MRLLFIFCALIGVQTVQAAVTNQQCFTNFLVSVISIYGSDRITPVVNDAGKGLQQNGTSIDSMLQAVIGPVANVVRIDDCTLVYDTYNNVTTANENAKQKPIMSQASGCVVPLFAVAADVLASLQGALLLKFSASDRLNAAYGLLCKKITVAYIQSFMNTCSKNFTATTWNLIAAALKNNKIIKSGQFNWARASG